MVCFIFYLLFYDTDQNLNKQHACPFAKYALNCNLTVAANVNFGFCKEKKSRPKTGGINKK